MGNIRDEILERVTQEQGAMQDEIDAIVKKYLGKVKTDDMDDRRADLFLSAFVSVVLAVCTQTMSNYTSALMSILDIKGVEDEDEFINGFVERIAFSVTMQIKENRETMEERDAK